MHYNFETKAALGPSLGFWEVEGPVTFTPSLKQMRKTGLKRGGESLWGESLGQHGMAGRARVTEWKQWRAVEQLQSRLQKDAKRRSPDPLKSRQL